MLLFAWNNRIAYGFYIAASKNGICNGDDNRQLIKLPLDNEANKKMKRNEIKMNGMELNWMGWNEMNERNTQTQNKYLIYSEKETQNERASTCQLN